MASRTALRRRDESNRSLLPVLKATTVLPKANATPQPVPSVLTEFLFVIKGNENDIPAARVAQQCRPFAASAANSRALLAAEISSPGFRPNQCPNQGLR